MSKWHIIFSMLILLVTEIADGQKKSVHNTIAEERIRIEASSATVLEWFEKIEKEKQIILSYNPSLIDLDKICSIEFSGEISIGELLQKILKEYKYKTTQIPPRKLAIQIQKTAYFYISGSVSEENSGERLYGALVTLTLQDKLQAYAITDENGIFKISVPEGSYHLNISYMGYTPYEQDILIDSDRVLYPQLKPFLFEIEEVTVKSRNRENELDEFSPSNRLSFNGNDLFSQIWILPGVTGLPTGNHFQVDGGKDDENQLLLDGVPVFHPGHINSLLPIFNGDAVKNIIFHQGFFPTRLEGKLSSVTEIKLKDGNKQEHIRTLTLDMPAASLQLEGPIIQNKLSYLVSTRRSWLDFFDNLFSDENRFNHASYDYIAKLSYDVSPTSSIKALAYGTRDDYHLPIEPHEKVSILRWDNQIYKLSYNTLFGKVSNTTSAFYSSYLNRAYAELLGFETEGYLHSRIKSWNISTEFSYSPENTYSVRWGAKYAYETYQIASWGDSLQVRHEPIDQFSIFYDNHIRIARDLFVQVGVHFVGYLPQKHRSYYSIQPRLSLKYSSSPDDIFYLNFSKMEQFYHHLRFDFLSLPTDFRMPSIERYKPRTSEHYELGWKHFLGNGQVEVSTYYKTRRNLLALRPETFIYDDQWQNYIMSGDGDSYGAKFYLYNQWNRWTVQLSYTYARSREWFPSLSERGKLPSLYDVPHQLSGAVSYQLSPRSILSAGGLLRSGKIIDMDDNFDPLPANRFRSEREAANYRIDAGYSYKKDFGEKLLLLRFGLYNIMGNPPEEEVLNFYSVHWHNNCLPYGSISFKF